MSPASQPAQPHRRTVASRRRGLWGTGIAVIAALMVAPAAMAYPSSIVFAPNADVNAFGEADVYVYAALNAQAPSVWSGVNVGVCPAIPYGNSGLTFGGVEVSMDVISQVGVDPLIKPIGAFKVNLLTEGDYHPAVGVGMMDVAVFNFNRSLNLGFGALSKSFSVLGVPLGRLTLGGGMAVPGADDQFSGTFPFATDSKAYLMGGYESPAIGPVNLAVDHLGGINEAAGTNVVANITMSESTMLTLGYYFYTDRSAPQNDAFFVNLGVGWQAFGEPAKEAETASQ